jgi:hypothetical protein
MKKYFWMIAILVISGTFVSNSANAQRYGGGGRGGYSHGGGNGNGHGGYGRGGGNGYAHGGYGRGGGGYERGGGGYAGRGGYRGGYGPRVVVRGGGGYGYAPGYAYGGGYAPAYDGYGYDPYYAAPAVRVVVPAPGIFLPHPRFFGGHRGRRW